MEIIYAVIATVFYFIGGIGYGKVAAEALGSDDIDIFFVVLWPLAAMVAAIAFKRGE